MPDVAIAGIVGFHNTASPVAIVDWAGGSNCVRERLGCVRYVWLGCLNINFWTKFGKIVAINNDVQPWSQAFTTSLPAGIYCNIIHGSVVSRFFNVA